MNEIIKLLKEKKSIPLDEFINIALYDKKFGYYMKSNPFGKEGDYVTSPLISNLFGDMIGIWCVSFWEHLGKPKKISLVELGPGDGTLCKNLLNVFKKFKDFYNCFEINLLEKSNYLKKKQKKEIKNKKVKWIKNIKHLNSGPLIFLGNEFFDALPIKQFIKKNNKWHERNVKFFKLNRPKFIDVLIDIKKFEKKIGFKISHKQKFIEYSPLSIKYLKIISKKINSNNGGILIIDYGYWSSNMKNTLKSISNHKFNEVLNNFGRSDITYNLSFKLLEKILKKFNLKIGGMTNQKNFLINLGILKRAEIISKNLPFSKKADIYFRVKRLIDKNSMGELFKVILATKKNVNFQTGFIN